MTEQNLSASRASFSHIAAGTQNDGQIIFREFVPFANALPDRILAHLRLLDGDFGGFPVDRLTHSLQTAPRAYRDGLDEEYVVCALLHDIGDTLCPYNHAELAAAILKPFVSEANHWMVQHHGIFTRLLLHSVNIPQPYDPQWRGPKTDTHTPYWRPLTPGNAVNANTCAEAFAGNRTAKHAVRVVILISACAN